MTDRARRTDREHWESQAEHWAAFTRGAIPDAYPSYAPRFFPFLPSPGRATLEIGCGEGRVCRDLRARGYDPIGIDGSPTMIRLAAAADPSGDYRVADAGALPFPVGAFDLVVAYNMLMDVDDLDGVVAEAARVLAPAGRLVASITHPIADVGRFAARAADAPFVVTGDYLTTSPYEWTAVTRNGVTMEFSGWARPLAAYSGALERAGLLIEAIREPAAPDQDVAVDPAERRWQRLPQFLWFRALKPG